MSITFGIVRTGLGSSAWVQSANGLERGDASKCVEAIEAGAHMRWRVLSQKLVMACAKFFTFPQSLTGVQEVSSCTLLPSSSRTLNLGAPS